MDLRKSFILIKKADKEFIETYIGNNHVSVHLPEANDKILTEDFFDN